MNDHDFERAVRALRDEGNQPAPQARLTRERVLRDLRPRARRLRRALWMVPLAALLAGSTVLAATGRLPEVLHVAARALRLEARPTAPPVARPAPTPAAATAPAPAVAVPEASRDSENAVVPEPSSATSSANDAAQKLLRGDAGASLHARAHRRSAPENAGEFSSAAAVPTSASSVAAPSAAAPSAAGTSDDQGALALYRRARQLHFVEQKPAAALAAWDAYLAADPSGPLSVDARYERALCLLRLGRKSEAGAALEPFAAGKYGGYRQSDARALLDALE